MSSKLCDLCSKKLYKGKGIKVNEFNFHKGCFACNVKKCKSKLSGSNYKIVEGSVYCLDHLPSLTKENELLKPKPLNPNENASVKTNTTDDNNNNKNQNKDENNETASHTSTSSTSTTTTQSIETESVAGSSKLSQEETSQSRKRKLEESISCEEKCGRSVDYYCLNCSRMDGDTYYCDVCFKEAHKHYKKPHHKGDAELYFRLRKDVDYEPTTKDIEADLKNRLVQITPKENKSIDKVVVNENFFLDNKIDLDDNLIIIPFIGYARGYKSHLMRQLCDIKSEPENNLPLPRPPRLEKPSPDIHGYLIKGPEENFPSVGNFFDSFKKEEPTPKKTHILFLDTLNGNDFNTTQLMCNLGDLVCYVYPGSFRQVQAIYEYLMTSFEKFTEKVKPSLLIVFTPISSNEGILDSAEMTKGWMDIGKNKPIAEFFDDPAVICVPDYKWIEEYIAQLVQLKGIVNRKIREVRAKKPLLTARSLLQKLKSFSEEFSKSEGKNTLTTQ